MKTIGFIDDSEDELRAFRDVMEEDTGFKVVTAKSSGEFLARLASEKQVDLILFDLYFPLENREPGPSLSKEALCQELESLQRRCDALTSAQESDRQLAMADFIRREAENLMVRLLNHYAQGPKGGLNVFQKVREHYALVPSAFLSRKRTADDIHDCLTAGALKVLLKPSTKRQDADFGSLALWGWQEHKQKYVDILNDLMSQDVVESYLTRVEELLVGHDFKKSRLIRESITKAKCLWINTGRSKEDIGKLRLFVEQATDEYKKMFGPTAVYDLMKFLAGLAAGSMLR